MIELKILLSLITIMLMIYIVVKSKVYILAPLFLTHIAIKIDSFVRHSEAPVSFESIRWSAWALALYFCIAVAVKNRARIRITGFYFIAILPLFLLVIPWFREYSVFITSHAASSIALAISGFVFIRSLMLLSSSQYASTSAIISMIYLISEIVFRFENDIEGIFSANFLDASIFYGWYAIESILLIILLRITVENAKNS